MKKIMRNSEYKYKSEYTFVDIEESQRLRNVIIKTNTK